MIHRTYAATLAAVLVWTAFWADAARAAPRLDAEEIKAALHTAAPEEDGFVDRVVDLAHRGVLPLSMVDSTFQWARKKNRHRFQYFKRGMILRAARIGVQL
jgi:hypothetical protein